MSYKQIKGFDPQRMGKKSGYCLQNVRLGFGISKGTYASAKVDMDTQKKAGTFHAGTPPTNIAVPVYFDTASKYEHVMACDHGIYYSDGKRLSNINGWKVFGWGELCDGQRVVQYTADPAPAPSTGFLPAKGYWAKGDRDARIGQLASFMRATFPAYTSKSALGNYYGAYIRDSIVTFQKKTGLLADGCVGPKTYAKLKSYGFKG